MRDRRAQAQAADSRTGHVLVASLAPGFARSQHDRLNVLSRLHTATRERLAVEQNHAQSWPTAWTATGLPSMTTNVEAGAGIAWPSLSTLQREQSEHIGSRQGEGATAYDCSRRGAEILVLVSSPI